MADIATPLLTRLGSPTSFEPDLKPTASEGLRLVETPPPVLQVRDLRVSLPTEQGLRPVLKGIHFELRAGEVLGLVGESGSGKSMTVRALLGLLPAQAQLSSQGIAYQGQPLSAEALRRLRGREMAMIFQNPLSAFNPTMRLGDQIGEILEFGAPPLARRARRQRVLELLDRVGIQRPEQRMRQYPHEFSGGMLQRAMIAMAISHNPRILIADEATSNLDVTIQAEILTLVRELQRELGMAMIWITHDLGVLAGLANRILVMFAGQVVEEAATATLFQDPRHPYTRTLLAALHDPLGRQSELIPAQTIPGGCPFHMRCRHCHTQCLLAPALQSVAAGHRVACWRPELSIAERIL